jgi:hypothetical protein
LGVIRNDHLSSYNVTYIDSITALSIGKNVGVQAQRGSPLSSTPEARRKTVNGAARKTAVHLDPLNTVV